MDQHQVAWNEKVAQTIIKNLGKRRMAGSYAAGTDQARDEVIDRLSLRIDDRCGHGAVGFNCGPAGSQPD